MFQHNFIYCCFVLLGTTNQKRKSIALRKDHTETKISFSHKPSTFSWLIIHGSLNIKVCIDPKHQVLI